MNKEQTARAGATGETNSPQRMERGTQVHATGAISHRWQPVEIAHVAYEAWRVAMQYDADLPGPTTSWRQMSLPQRQEMIDIVRAVIDNPRSSSGVGLTGILVTNIIRILATGREPMAVTWLEHEAELLRRGATKLLNDIAAAGAKLQDLEHETPVVQAAVAWVHKQAVAHGVPVDQIEIDAEKLLEAARRVAGVVENPPAPKDPGDVMDRVEAAQAAHMERNPAPAPVPVPVGVDDGVPASDTTGPALETVEPAKP